MAELLSPLSAHAPTRSHGNCSRFQHPLIKPYVRFSRIRLSGQLPPAAFAFKVHHKSDRRRRLDAEVLSRKFKGLPAVLVSARNGTGIAGLKKALVRSFMADPAGRPSAAKFLVNSRQESALRNAAGSLRSAISALQRDGQFELAALDIRRALDELGMITGEVTSDDILGMIFSRFCIGK